MATDYSKSRLKAAHNPALLDAILQEECRERFGNKFPSLVANSNFRFPDLTAGEQATSESLARARWQCLGVGGERVLDMTCGLGVDSMTAAMCGATVTAIELDPHRAETARANAQALGIETLDVVNADSAEWIRDYRGETFDTIFIDPSRRDNGTRRYAFSDCAPDLTTLLPTLREKSRRLVVKASPMLDVEATRRLLGEDCRIELWGTPRECKELVVVTPAPPETVAVTLHPDGATEAFPLAAGIDEIAPRLPREGDIIYEPYPSVMKGIAGHRIGLPKLHRDTHLFLAEEPVGFFPGNGYRIERVLPMGKAAVRQLAAEKPEFQIAVRNFPMTSAELRQRLKARESDTRRLFAVTLPTGRYLISTIVNATFQKMS